MSTTDTRALTQALREARLEGYARLRGGYPLPLAGMLVWAGLGVWGMSASLYDWAMAAYAGSGLLFPLAVVLSLVLRRPFLGQRLVTDSVLAPALIGMLLFWPMVVAAGFAEAYELIPLILAIGMATHWPVIGWSYGRTWLFTAHAVARAGAVLFIWTVFPEHRLDWMPLSVAAIYGLTVLAILADTARLRRRSEGLAMA